jgi:pSer/pThr/pTyr-binding forkhead associated (FHA) protein/outer membrane biosynthesis protein TonB
VQKELGNSKSIFQLVPVVPNNGIIPSNLTVGRYLVGRTESCEVIIPKSDVSSVHAVLEVTPRGFIVYDMNSKNGTFVNGEKVVSREVPIGGVIKFGKTEFKVSKYSAKESLPPVLSTLEPEQGDSSVFRAMPEIPTDNKPQEEIKPNLPVERPNIESDVEDDVPYIIYPLSSDPNSDYSEYIFEDSAELYPIFKYELNKQAVEVIILFKDKVYSVDYLPEKEGVYKIAGATDNKKEIEFPYLGKQEIVPFVEINKGNCIVSQLHNYELLHLKDSEIITSSDGAVNIQGNDIVKLKSEDLEIFVRRIAAPPKVKPAPFFRRDKDLKKYIFMMLLIVLLPIIALNIIEVDKEKDDEKDPERIATILYKQKLRVNVNKTVAVSEKKKPKKKQTAKKKPVVKKSKPKKKQATSQKSNIKTAKTTPNPGSKKAPKVQKVKRVKNPAPKKTRVAKTLKTTSSAKSSATKTARTRRAKSRSKSAGRVDVYKSMNFKSTVSPLVAKGGSLRGARTAKTTSGVTSSGVSGGVATNVPKASVGTEVGSLTGSTVGKLGESKGTKGLSAKTGVYTAGIPSETVVLGSMDPDVIRRILRDNIPFFRSCYQKELDSNSGRNVSGTIRLVFSIGASGHVSRAGVDGRTKLTPKVKRCVVGVLKGIKFPRPLGGGTVDVKQPFNFYPKRI